MCIQLGQADPRLTREALNSSARAELGFERSFELSENSVELVKPFHPTFAATEYDSEPFPITLNRNLTIALAHFAAESEVNCDLYCSSGGEYLSARNFVTLENSGSYSSMPFPRPAETFVDACHRVVCGSIADVNKFS